MKLRRSKLNHLKTLLANAKGQLIHKSDIVAAIAADEAELAVLKEEHEIAVLFFADSGWPTREDVGLEETPLLDDLVNCAN